MTEEEKENLIIQISDLLNDKGVYTDILNLSIAHTGKHIHHDSEFWKDVEENIVELIDKYEE